MQSTSTLAFIWTCSYRGNELCSKKSGALSEKEIEQVNVARVSRCA